MDEQEHKDFFTRIAKEVGKLTVKPANLNRFRQQDRIFWEKCKAYCQAVEQDRRAAESDPRLQNKEAGPPKKGYVWYDQQLSKTIPKGYWRRPEKGLTPNPIDWLSIPSLTDELLPGMFSIQCQAPETEEILLAYYVLLTIIHDNEKIDNIQINNGIWSEDEDWVRWILEEDLNWEYLKERHVGNRLRVYIELALDHVKADLARRQGDKRSIISWIVKGIIALALLVICLYFFGVVKGIFVFAAMLTIFHYLGWLEPIRAFISNILRPK